MEMETMGLGAGSYPEPPEPKDKCYVITCSCSAKVEYAVWAENYDEAVELLRSGDYSEKEVKELEIEDIDSYEIE